MHKEKMFQARVKKRRVSQERLNRFYDVKAQIVEILYEICRGQDVQPDAYWKWAAYEVWCPFAARAVMQADPPIVRTWAGGNDYGQVLHGARSSCHVMFGDRKPFAEPDGYRVQAAANRGWVLDSWEVAIKAWRTRQTEIIVTGRAST